LLAGGAAGANSLSLGVADYAALSNCRDCHARSFRAVVRDVFASGEITARAPGDLKAHKKTFCKLIPESYQPRNAASGSGDRESIRVVKAVIAMRF
jgi:hypothetical protein